MNKVVELFSKSALQQETNWQKTIAEQRCTYTNRKCYKIRKSDPDVSIGTCTVLYGKKLEPIIICPKRLLERRQIFTDSLHLLSTHEPGNELHIVSEVSIPGGSVDYVLVSTKDNKIKDFVGIELQTLDTTGTVWPERQRLLKELGILRKDNSEGSNKSFGMNWKMTAKTILVQMHHKIHTFEHVNKKLVLVTQDKLLDYMKREFNFSHMRNPASIGDAMHLHAYQVDKQADKSYKLKLQSRLSTSSDGIELCLGLQTEARIELNQIISELQAKISSATLFVPV
ncbi:Restriction endonuclease NotI [Nitrosomonas marina]|uniref:Restriction endonuclease NotI n=1 Tax=Nitrosomonas marina TaxID=917 RepID=A0A1I0FTX3_9PROT|nr:NotI family restriction endonuclease [Nitrosomonas marina]SET61819.1 Restriction endonuclease NotI [Nitrosomonas marina]